MGVALAKAVEEAEMEEGTSEGKGKAKKTAAGKGGWRVLMGATRDAARTLVRRDLLVVTLRGGVEVGAEDEWRGPCRFRLGLAETRGKKKAKVEGT